MSETVGPLLFCEPHFERAGRSIPGEHIVNVGTPIEEVMCADCFRGMPVLSDEVLGDDLEARQREARQTRKRTRKPGPTRHSIAGTYSALKTIWGKTSAQLDAIGLFCPCGPCCEKREAIADLKRGRRRRSARRPQPANVSSDANV